MPSLSARSAAILDHFAGLRDPREGWRVLYPLSEILLLVLCATLSGMDDFVETKLWGEQRLDFLRRFLPYERGIPAHDTLNDVINGLDADLFKACFTSWVETLRDGQPDSVAVDGKTSRRCHARGKSWLWSDRRYADEPRFPHLAMIGMVETRTERQGRIERERRYDLSSAKLDAQTFAKAVRTHWHIENRLHWTLDVVFHDDLVPLRTGDGPQNMAVVRHIAMNMLRLQDDKHSLKIRRKLPNLKPDYLSQILKTA